MRIIVGLGNPGEKYKNTRHNAGFMAADAIAAALNLAWKKNKKFKAETAAGENFMLVKPETYMNESGKSVQAALNYFKLSADSHTLLVMHDDIDIELGKYKLAVGSRSAGHNGVQSIIDQLKTKIFTRLRLGVKTEEKEKIGAKNFVLKNFNKEEKIILNKVIKEAADKIILELEK